MALHPGYKPGEHPNSTQLKQQASDILRLAVIISTVRCKAVLIE